MTVPKFATNDQFESNKQQQIHMGTHSMVGTNQLIFGICAFFWGYLLACRSRHPIHLVVAVGDWVQVLYVLRFIKNEQSNLDLHALHGSQWKNYNLYRSQISNFF